MLLVPSRARAEESGGLSPETERTIATATVIGGGALSVLSLGAAVLFSSQANEAYDDRRSIADRNGGASGPVWRCAATNECGRMATLREDQDTATARYDASVGVAIAGAFIATTALVTWLAFGPSTSSTRTETGAVRVGAGTDGRGANVGVGGTF
jgi:hypothetical protein